MPGRVSGGEKEEIMKKLTAILLAGILSAGMLAGCGSSDSSESDSNTGTASGSASSTVSDAGVTTINDGVLTMATNATFPPYEYYDGDDIVGIDVEIAQAIADKLGLELKVDDMEFNSIINAIQQGKADVALAGMTVTPEREENVNFSETYATGIQSIIVPEDSDIASVDDLEGKKIGVQLSTTGDIYATEDYGSDNVDQYNKGADAVMALKQGKVDAVIIDNEPAKNFVASNEGLKILDTDYAVEDYAIALNKDNTELLDAVNGALQELIDDGTVQSIIDKYIDAE